MGFFLHSLLDPPILFFLLGVSSVFLKSQLKIPRSVSSFLSLYLLMALGFKGGVFLVKNGFGEDLLAALVGGLLFASLIPYLLFRFLKKTFGPDNAAAIGATYGSVSAVTFVTATSWLEARGMTFDGSMIAVLVLMEAPAIVMAIFLIEQEKESSSSSRIGKLIKKSLLNSSVYLLLGSLLVGILSGVQGQQSVGHFLIDLFKGFLGFFLLDMGIKTATQLKKTPLHWNLLAVGLLTPLVVSFFTLGWCLLTEMGQPDSFLLLALTSSGSYIAVPAALRTSIPQANPGIFLTLALGITFPFNILVGLPLYWNLVQLWIPVT
jgi:uncharacterized protein